MSVIKRKRPRLESHGALRRTALPRKLLTFNLGAISNFVNNYAMPDEYACTVTSVCADRSPTVTTNPRAASIDLNRGGSSRLG
jgi:hypothetical protein